MFITLIVRALVIKVECLSLIPQILYECIKIKLKVPWVNPEPMWKLRCMGYKLVCDNIQKRLLQNIEWAIMYRSSYCDSLESFNGQSQLYKIKVSYRSNASIKVNTIVWESSIYRKAWLTPQQYTPHTNIYCKGLFTRSNRTHCSLSFTLPQDRRGGQLGHTWRGGIVIARLFQWSHGFSIKPILWNNMIVEVTFSLFYNAAVKQLWVCAD